MPSSEDVADWLRDYGDEMYRFALLRLHDEDVAQDLVQESFLAAWRARDSFKGGSTRKTWLIGILKHKIIDHIRKQIRQRKLHDALEEDPVSPWFHSNHSWRDANRRWHNSPDQLHHDNSFREALGQCLAKLPLRQRQVFILREMVGEDSDTVCNHCEITPTNLHVLMHRARLALQHCLNKHGFGL